MNDFTCLGRPPKTDGNLILAADSSLMTTTIRVGRTGVVLSGRVNNFTANVLQFTILQFCVDERLRGFGANLLWVDAARLHARFNSLLPLFELPSRSQLQLRDIKIIFPTEAP